MKNNSHTSANDKLYKIAKSFWSNENLLSKKFAGFNGALEYLHLFEGKHKRFHSYCDEDFFL